MKRFVKLNYTKTIGSSCEKVQKIVKITIISKKNIDF